MPRSDKRRHAPPGKTLQYERPEAPAIYPKGDSGNVPDLNHSDGVPMTDNTRPPRKSRVIFDK
jgi:hypothetical protein